VVDVGTPDPWPGGPDFEAYGEVRTRLREALLRNEWELGFNRAGKLSPPQCDQLRRRARGRVWLRLAGVFAGAVAALLALTSAAITLQDRAADPLNNLVAGIVGGALGLVVVWLTVRARRSGYPARWQRSAALPH
jgi:hypothetical protein